MPINYFQPLDQLRNLTGSGFRPSTVRGGLTDDPDSPGTVDANLLALQTQRRDETATNATKGLAMAAPNQSIHELTADIDDNPITKQRGEVADYMGALGEANQQGFATPKEFAGYKRNIDEEKLRQPMQIATANNAADLEKQRLANAGGLDIAKENAESYRNRTDNDFLKTLALIGGRQNVADSNIYSRQLGDLEKQHSIGVGGKRLSDEEYTRRRAEIEGMRGGAQAPTSGGGGLTSQSFAQSLRRDYPQASLNDLITLAQSPDNSIGGVDDPDELNKLRQHFIALGAR